MEKIYLMDSNMDGVIKGTLYRVRIQCVAISGLGSSQLGMQDEVEHGGWKGVAWFLKIINFPK
jgi:hypothetical protein